MTAALLVCRSFRAMLGCALMVSLTVPARLTDLATCLIPRPVSRRVPAVAIVAVRTALPFRWLSFGLESEKEFEGFGDRGTADDGEARTVNDVVPLLASCVTSPE